MQKFRDYIRSNDPGNFALIFGFKAILTIAFCGYIGYVFFGLIGCSFAINAVMNIFFLGALECNNTKKTAYLLLYILLVCAFLPLSPYAYELGVYLCIPTFLWMFVVGASNLFSPNLNKILAITNMSGLVALITNGSEIFNTKEALCGMIIGGVVATFMRVVHFGSYGSFTKKVLNLMISDLEEMAQNLDNQKNFDHFLSELNIKLARLKTILESRSSNLKDASLILHHSRVVFYMYKVEDMASSLMTLRKYFSKDYISQYEQIKEEIKFNLTALKMIFKDAKIPLKKEEFDKILASNHPLFASSLKVLYSKFELFYAGGEDKIALKPKVKRNFKEIFANFNLENETIKDALKLAFGVSVALFLAMISKIDHGIWIAIGVIILSRANLYQTKIAGINNIFGGFIGLLLGILIIFTLKDTPFFTVIVFFGFFMIYYVKEFKGMIFAVSFMSVFTMIFSLLRQDFIALMILRLVDIVIGFLVVVVSGYFFYKDQKDKFIPEISSILSLFDTKFKNGFIECNDGGKLDAQLANEIYLFKRSIKEEGVGFSGRRKLLSYYISFYKLNLELLALSDLLETMLGRSDILKSDLIVIKRRFEMLNNKSQNLPYYFYDDTNAIFICKNERILKRLKEISNLQAQIYTLLNDRNF